jgi:hypothetical protein
MSISLEDALLTVWRQSLLENKKTVTLEDASFPVRSTAKRKLKQIDFQFDGKELRGTRPTATATAASNHPPTPSSNQTLS